MRLVVRSAIPLVEEMEAQVLRVMMMILESAAMNRTEVSDMRAYSKRLATGRKIACQRAPNIEQSGAFKAVHGGEMIVDATEDGTDEQGENEKKNHVNNGKFATCYGARRI